MNPGRERLLRNPNYEVPMDVKVRFKRFSLLNFEFDIGREMVIWSEIVVSHYALLETLLRKATWQWKQTPIFKSRKPNRRDVLTTK